ncbi:MAG: uracil-DNA glycosylase [Helicobacteraceae bacterium]|nr:uracil-DNA glycosylase [Helicobacteraceae bacterium]
MTLSNSWKELLHTELQKEYYQNLSHSITNEYNIKTVFPPYNDIYRAFDLIEPEDVKVVIIGQDPYHGRGQANGLAFSVARGCKIPPSLRNIYKELHDDIGCEIPDHGNLEKWAREGVLLINSVLSVLESQANSHKEKGWEIFTDSVIRILSERFNHIVFVLWGNPSQKKSALIDETKHCILRSAHPSPLSAFRGFFGSKPFSQANNYLEQCGRGKIDWCITPLQQTLL